MSWQNLTPQLRTRLSRMERVVGLFFALAVFCLLCGLAYYLYQTAQRKGWFLIKAPYFTFVDNAAGMTVGDKVYLMGFEVGEIVEITAMPPFEEANVYVGFVVREPYYGYLWQDSRARVAAGNLLGNRSIEVTKGIYGLPTYLLHELKEFSLPEALALKEPHGWKFNQKITDPSGTNLLAKVYAPVTRAVLNRLASLGTNSIRVFDAHDLRRRIMAAFDETVDHYVELAPDSKGYYLRPDESPALSDRIERVVNTVEGALPNILQLTNRLTEALTNLASAAARAGQLVADAQPTLSNLDTITGQLTDPEGSFGQWLIPPDLREQLDQTLETARTSLQAAQATVQTAQTNLTPLARTLLASLENLALLTSNLNSQVEANQFILSDLSDLVRHTDQAVQGLKRHWLFKGAFLSETNPVPRSLLQPKLVSPP